MTQIASSIVIGDERMNVTDRSVVQPLDGFSKTAVVAYAKAGDDRQVLAFGFRTGFQYRAHSRRIDGNRLFREHMLARIDGCFEVHRPKMRRRC